MTPDLAPSWLDREAYPFESRWLTVPAGHLHHVDEGVEDHDPAKGWSPAARPGAADDRVRDAPSEPRPQPWSHYSPRAVRRTARVCATRPGSTRSP